MQSKIYIHVMYVFGNEKELIQKGKEMLRGKIKQELQSPIDLEVRIIL